MQKDHPLSIGNHMPAPMAFSSEKGQISEGSEIVILHADHMAGIYTVMDCFTGLVIRNTPVPIIATA